MGIQAVADKIAGIWNTLSSVSVLWALLAVVFALVIYFLPTILARIVGNTSGRVLVIGILNLLFGWTGLGWFALLGWGLIGRPRESEDVLVGDDNEVIPFIHSGGTS